MEIKKDIFECKTKIIDGDINHPSMIFITYNEDFIKFVLGARYKLFKEKGLKYLLIEKENVIDSLYGIHLYDLEDTDILYGLPFIYAIDVEGLDQIISELEKEYKYIPCDPYWDISTKEDGGRFCNYISAENKHEEKYVKFSLSESDVDKLYKELDSLRNLTNPKDNNSCV